MRPRKQYSPHKSLEEGWTYVSIPGDNIVVAVRVSINKIMKLHDANDRPLVDPAGLPTYEIQSTNIIKTLTQEEYALEKRELWGGN